MASSEAAVNCYGSSWAKVPYSGLHDVQDGDPSSCKHSTSQCGSQPCGCPRKQIISISWREDSETEVRGVIDAGLGAFHTTLG